jgi:hypothetical protein
MENENQKYTLDDFIKMCDSDKVFRELKKADREAYVARIIDGLTKLEAHIGRDLTEYESIAVFDIAEEFTPKDGNGKHWVEELLPLPYAWKIYEARRKIILDRFCKLLRNEEEQV